MYILFVNVPIAKGYTQAKHTQALSLPHSIPFIKYKKTKQTKIFYVLKPIKNSLPNKNNDKYNKW